MQGFISKPLDQNGVFNLYFLIFNKEKKGFSSL